MIEKTFFVQALLILLKLLSILNVSWIIILLPAILYFVGLLGIIGLLFYNLESTSNYYSRKKKKT